MRRPIGRNYVRVRFTPGGKTYVYYCREARKGDTVRVPPSSYCAVPQRVRVVGYGRRLWFGKVKTAVLNRGVV